MKNILFVLVILFAISCKKEEAFTRAAHIPSKIDNLNTEDEIEAYIRKLDTNLRDFYLVDYKRIMTFKPTYVDSLNRIYAKQLGINKTFYKTDFNNDGLTDLLLIGGWKNGNVKPKDQLYQFNSQIVINGGEGKSTTYSIARDYNFAFVPQILYTDSLPLLVLHHSQNFDTVRPPSRDTLQVKLVYKSGYFVEFNKKYVKHHEIKKIEFTNVLGESGPFFQMILNKNKESWFIAISNNLEEHRYNEGTYKTTIKDSHFNAISDLLNYIDFKNLQEDYSIYNTGPPSMALRITYDNGKIKEIFNNAGAGTYGLEAVYQLMMELRYSQDWKPGKEPKNIRMPRPEKRTRWKA
jgi:hypothetical protein